MNTAFGPIGTKTQNRYFFFLIDNRTFQRLFILSFNSFWVAYYYSNSSLKTWNDSKIVPGYLRIDTYHKLSWELFNEDEFSWKNNLEKVSWRIFLTNEFSTDEVFQSFIKSFHSNNKVNNENTKIWFYLCLIFTGRLVLYLYACAVKILKFQDSVYMETEQFIDKWRVKCYPLK